MASPTIALPPPIQTGLGQEALERLEMKQKKMNELLVRGDIKPATLLNMLPFELALGDGLISYKIPKAPVEKPHFHIHTVTTCRSYDTYKGNQEMSDRTKRKRFEVNIVLPIVQLMEFKHYYMDGAGESGTTARGGVVVFEGDFKGLKPESIVRAPRFMFIKRDRYLVYDEVPLGDLIKDAEEVMKRQCMAAIVQADTWYDDEKKRANIQNNERTWHDLALRREWITQARPWRSGHVDFDARCPRCQKQYVSKTGVCSCGYVVEPLQAFLSAEIEFDHVRMNSLSKDQWAKAKAEQKRREEARA